MARDAYKYDTVTSDQSTPPRRAPAAPSPPSPQLPATTCLVAATLGGYCLQALAAPTRKAALLDLSLSPVTMLLCKRNGRVVLNREWYRLATCAFVHTSLPHLLVNVYGMLRVR